MPQFLRMLDRGIVCVVLIIIERSANFYPTFVLQHAVSATGAATFSLHAACAACHKDAHSIPMSNHEPCARLATPTAQGKPALSALLALLCSAVLVLVFWPYVTRHQLVSLVSKPRPVPLSTLPLSTFLPELDTAAAIDSKEVRR